MTDTPETAEWEPDEPDNATDTPADTPDEQPATPPEPPPGMKYGASGKLVNWDRTADLGKIAVPTLAIGARYDTMEPAQMERIAKGVKKGRYLFCPNGSHLAMYDDQQTYFAGLVDFLTTLPK